MGDREKCMHVQEAKEGTGVFYGSVPYCVEIGLFHRTGTWLLSKLSPPPWNVEIPGTRSLAQQAEVLLLAQQKFSPTLSSPHLHMLFIKQAQITSHSHHQNYRTDVKEVKLN